MRSSTTSLGERVLAYRRSLESGKPETRILAQDPQRRARSSGHRLPDTNALGNPQDNRDSFRRGDGEEGRQRMREILDNGSGDALRRLVDDARGARIAALCVERDRLRCHRDVITEMVKEIDPTIDVLQIL